MFNRPKFYERVMMFLLVDNVQEATIKANVHASRRTNEDGDHMLVFTYYQTDVVVVNLRNKGVYVQTGGHWTVTTKAIINEILKALELPQYFRQRGSAWLLSAPGQDDIRWDDERLGLVGWMRAG